MSFTTALTKELDRYTPCILEEGKVEQRKIHRRLYALIREILRETNRAFSENSKMKLVEVLRYSAKKHQGVYRKDKVTPYFLHPLEVALIIIKLGILDFKIIAAAILHDVVEDTDGTLKEISTRFGSDVRNIVDLMTKQKLEKNKERYWQRIQNEIDLHCKWRVIVLKYADRIHYFMTSSAVTEENKQKHVLETNTEFPRLRSEIRNTFRSLQQKDTIKKKKYPEKIIRSLQRKLHTEMKRHM